MARLLCLLTSVAGASQPGDRLAYQTVYARRPGSVAAPTAGLHFTDEVFAHLAARGIAWVDLTLHVGLGTFRPIEAERLEDHVMHAEWAELSAQAVATLQVAAAAKGDGSWRSVPPRPAPWRPRPPVEPCNPSRARPSSSSARDTSFTRLDALITNFHLPRSSLLVLVSALAGLDLTRAAYAEAIRNRYRFFSYGDAMLIL